MLTILVKMAPTCSEWIRKRDVAYSGVCMTPWISQALCGCQGRAVVTHRHLRTVGKPVGRGKCGLAEGRRGRQEAGWNPSFLLSLHFQCVMEQWSYRPLPKTSVLLGSVGDAWSSWIFFFFFFRLDPFNFQHPEAENTFSARNCHLGRSLYSRSSQLTLTLVSEIVLLLFQVTPKIAT